MKDNILAVELAFNNAPADVCQQASEKARNRNHLYNQLHSTDNPCFVLSTCRRITVFTASSCPGKTMRFFVNQGVDKQYLKTYKNQQAVRHLLEIGSGLHSPNVGESEILFQLKNVLKESSRLKTLDVTLRKLLQKAIETGRRVRSETTILENSLSYPAIVNKILKERNIDLEGQKLLVIGNGKLGGSLIKYFLNKKTDITLATGSKEKTAGWGGLIDVIPREDIKYVLARFRVVLGAASVNETLIMKDDVLAVKENRPVFIDLGMPLNFDPQITHIRPGLLYNLDDIFSRVREMEVNKSHAIQQVRSIVLQESNAYMHWLKGRKAVRIIRILKDELEQIKSEEQNRLHNDFGEMDPQQKKIINNLVNRLASRIAHTHYSHIKEFVVHEQS